MDKSKRIKEATQTIEYLKKKQMEAANEINVFYSRTLDMIKAIESGKEIDPCLDYWIKLVDEITSSNFSEEGYFNAHVKNLVSIIDNMIKDLQSKEV